MKDGGDVGTGHWQQEVTGDDDINNNNGDVNRQIKESDKDPTAKGDNEREDKSEQVNTLRTRTVLPQPLTFWFLKNENTQQWNWKQNQQPVVTVWTEEHFWQLHNYLELASKLEDGSDYYRVQAGHLP